MTLSHHQVMENSICHRLKGQTTVTSYYSITKGHTENYIDGNFFVSNLNSWRTFLIISI